MAKISGQAWQLAGRALAHAVWSIAEGDSLIPLAMTQNPQQLLRFVDQPNGAREMCQQHLVQQHPKICALVTERTSRGHSPHRSLVVELFVKKTIGARYESATVLLPFRAKQDTLDFAVLGQPQLVQGQDFSLEDLLAGASEHKQGYEVWQKAAGPPSTAHQEPLAAGYMEAQLGFDHGCIVVTETGAGQKKIVIPIVVNSPEKLEKQAKAALRKAVRDFSEEADLSGVFVLAVKDTPEMTEEVQSLLQQLRWGLQAELSGLTTVSGNRLEVEVEYGLPAPGSVGADEYGGSNGLGGSSLTDVNEAFLSWQPSSDKWHGDAQRELPPPKKWADRLKWWQRILLIVGLLSLLLLVTLLRGNLRRDDNPSKQAMDSVARTLKGAETMRTIMDEMDAVVVEERFIEVNGFNEIHLFVVEGLFSAAQGVAQQKAMELLKQWQHKKEFGGVVRIWYPPSEDTKERREKLATNDATMIKVYAEAGYKTSAGMPIVLNSGFSDLSVSHHGQ